MGQPHEDSNTTVRHVRGHWDAPAVFCSSSPLPPCQESTEGKGLRQQQERFKLDNSRYCLTEGQMISNHLQKDSLSGTPQ